MISWIQRTFQHHFRLIFAVLLVGMVIPFIFTIGSTPGLGRAERTTSERDYFGHNLFSPEDKGRMDEDARISAELQYGQGISPEQIEAFMFQRVAAEHIAKQLHIPQPSQDEITNFIKDLRVFMGSNGQFDASKYDAYRSSLKLGSGLTEGDILRVISDDIRMAKVQRLLAGPGFVTGSDVAEIINKGDTSWTLSTVSVDYSKFETTLVPTEAEISKFFADNSFRYTVPPRVEVACVQFPAEKFISSQTATDAEVRQFYDSNPSRFPKPASADPKAKVDPASQFAAVQGQVRLALLTEKAKQSAVKAASDLAYALYDGKVTRQSLDSFLSAHNLKAAPLAPFTSEAGPAELGGSRELATAAFELNADRFYSEGLTTRDGAAVLFWKNSLPSYQPTLAEVHDRVRADAADNERRIKFVAFGRSLKAGIERRLKEGEPFDKAAAEAAAPVAVEVKAYPAFTLRAPPKDIDTTIASTLDRLEKGSISDMEATADKGILVYAADKKAPAIDPSSSHYAQVRAQLAANYARTTSSEAIREIVDNELKRTDTSTASK